MEVFSSEKPRVPHRAVGMSILLFLGTGTLAALMTVERSGDVLAPRVSPSGWSISFQLPRRFGDVQKGLTPLGPALCPTYMYGGLMRDGSNALFIVHRVVDAQGFDAQTLCDLVLESPAWSRPLVGPRGRQAPVNVKLGPFDGLQTVDRRQGVVVQAAVSGQGDAYALALWLESPPLDNQTLAMFRGICRSIERQSP